jgi:hypothetical protein
MRHRGGIDVLPSGALRVRVYTGLDPVTKRRRYMSEIIPPGPHAAREAEKARTRLLSQVDEKRHPRTSATLNELLDKVEEVIEVEVSTKKGYRGYAKNHIRPVLGSAKLADIDAEKLDTFYSMLRRCRDRCGGRRYIVHAPKRKSDPPEHVATSAASPTRADR